MKVICNGADLADACLKVSKAVSQKTTMPILEGIKLTAEGKFLTLSATDLDLSIEKTVVADVLIEGETVVPGKFFADFIRKLTECQIQLAVVDNNKMYITYEDNQSVVSCMNAADFPEIRRIESAETFTIIKHELRDLLEKVVFSVSADEARPILKGVLLEIDDYSITGVALDGYRLAKTVKPLEKTTAKMNAIVPSRCVHEIIKLIDDSTDPVMVGIQKNILSIDLTHTRITAQLLDGDFINYRQIIPTQFTSAVTVPREELADALERAILLAKNEKNNLVRFDIKDGVMLLSSNSELGNIAEKIQIKNTGVDLAVAFNAKYILEILRFISSSHVVFNIISSTSPVVIVPGGVEEDSMYLVLPVRLV